MKTKRKKNDTRRVNQKYIWLLSTTFDKYKELTIIERKEEIKGDQETRRSIFCSDCMTDYVLL